MQQEIIESLKRQGCNITKSRRAFINALLRLQPASPQKLIDALPELDRATVYRNIELFHRLGIAKSVNVDKKPAIELSDNFQEHHHHLTCLGCGLVLDIQMPSLESAIEQAASSCAFMVVRHDLEINGYCRSCRNS